MSDEEGGGEAYTGHKRQKGRPRCFVGTRVPVSAVIMPDRGTRGGGWEESEGGKKRLLRGCRASRAGTRVDNVLHDNEMQKSMKG